jgi:hypothetical protein
MGRSPMAMAFPGRWIVLAVPLLAIKSLILLSLKDKYKQIACCPIYPRIASNIINKNYKIGIKVRKVQLIRRRSYG